MRLTARPLGPLQCAAVTAPTDTAATALGARAAPAPSGGAIELVRLEKRFGDFTAVDGIDLSIGAGEFFSLLGPSGCGKTTTLRLIAGFEQPTSGAILLDGVDLARTPPHKRPVNTVFQSYALFQHLTVEDNIAYGLRWQGGGVSKADRTRRVGDAIALVRLEGLAKRKPAQLSGGQQQRVALARALVLKPAVLLLDEPLGALDAKLRKALQHELTGLQRDVGITFVYVTHDQEEALTMSDRLAVMDNGIVSQVGPPRAVYTEPANAYVADFLGVANLLAVEALGAAPGGGSRVSLAGTELRCASGTMPGTGAAKIVIRPERARIVEYGATGENHLPGMIDRLVYLGPTTQVVVRLPHGDTVQVLVANTDERVAHEPGTAVTLVMPADALRVLPVDDRLDLGGNAADLADPEAAPREEE
jgi:spermidine/putrescine transport system ATP-binding protein